MRWGTEWSEYPSLLSGVSKSFVTGSYGVGLEALADGHQQQDGGQHDGCPHIFVGVLARLIASLEGIVGLLLQPGRLVHPGA